MANAKLHTATATAEKATTHATSPATQARLKPETFFADGSRIRLIEPMTPEREATLAWCKVAGLGGAWWDLGRCGGPGRRRPQSCSSTRPVGRAASPQEPLGPVACGLPGQAISCHSQPAAFCHSGWSGGGGAPQPRAPPCVQHGSQPFGATASVCPSVHASGVACLSGGSSAQASTRRKAFAAGVASGARCDSNRLPLAPKCQPASVKPAS